MKSLAKSILKTLEKSCHFSSIRGHTFWTLPLSQTSTVVDLGANRGDFSSELRKTYGCSVYAVEPNSSLTPVDSEFSIDRLAITSQSGTVKLIISDNPEASSLYHDLASSFGASHELDVPALTLTEYLLEKEITSQISVLKVDIEGGEIEVLKTLEESLSKIDQISVEFHIFISPSLKEDTLQVINSLKNSGFIVINCNYPYYDDFLFVNKRLLRKHGSHGFGLFFMKSIYFFRGIFHQVIDTSKAFQKISP